MLTTLRPREFWVKQRGAASPLKLRSLDMPTPKLTDDLWHVRQRLCALSGSLYGQRKDDLRKEIDNGRYNHHQPRGISEYEQA